MALSLTVIKLGPDVTTSGKKIVRNSNYNLQSLWLITAVFVSNKHF